MKVAKWLLNIHKTVLLVLNRVATSCGLDFLMGSLLQEKVCISVSFLSLSLFVCLSVFLSLSLCLCLRLSLSVSVSLCLSLSITLSLSFSLSICVCVSLCVSFCLSLSLCLSLTCFVLLLFRVSHPFFIHNYWYVFVLYITLYHYFLWQAHCDHSLLWPAFLWLTEFADACAAQCNVLIADGTKWVCYFSSFLITLRQSTHLYMRLGTFIGMSLMICVSFRYIGIWRC